MSEATLTSVKVCPGCGWAGSARTYDIGSGPEWNCPACDMCWGVRGQVLNVNDAWKIPRELHEQLPEWARNNPNWIIIEDEVDPSKSDQ